MMRGITKGHRKLSPSFAPRTDERSEGLLAFEQTRDRAIDVVREEIITISGVEAGHGQEMFRDMVGQIVCTHNLVAPLIERHVNVPDGPVECLRIFRRDAMHILRSRPGQFVDLAQFERLD
jgi:hypothetical protein